MNFFRSEEHLRRWEGYKEKMKGGIITLESLIELFGAPYFTNRGRPDYISHFSGYMAGLVGEIDRIPDAGNYWKLSSFEKTAFNLAVKLGLI
jgi:hypothetical protein